VLKRELPVRLPPSGWSLRLPPRLRSGFRQRARTPAKRLNFDCLLDFARDFGSGLGRPLSASTSTTSSTSLGASAKQGRHKWPLFHVSAESFSERMILFRSE